MRHLRDGWQMASRGCWAWAALIPTSQVYRCSGTDGWRIGLSCSVGARALPCHYMGVVPSLAKEKGISIPALERGRSEAGNPGRREAAAQRLEAIELSSKCPRAAAVRPNRRRHQEHERPPTSAIRGKSGHGRRVACEWLTPTVAIRGQAFSPSGSGTIPRGCVWHSTPHRAPPPPHGAELP